MEIDLLRKKIRQKTHNFFKKNNYKKINAFELYSPKYKTSNNLLYSAEIIFDKYKNNDDNIVIQPCSRVEDFNSNLEHKLPIFCQLSITSNYDKKKSIIDSFKYLIKFCNCDIQKIGIVAALNNPTYNFNDYKQTFLDIGIDIKNILLLDFPENQELYWKYPGLPQFNGFSISIYYSYECKNNIKKYNDYTKWLEIGEINTTYSNVTFGMERIEKVFFNIKYPKYNY